MNKIFEAALSVNEPWYIRDIEFDPDKKRLDLYVAIHTPWQSSDFCRVSTA
ncbi:MAG: hypothetical protein LWX01_01500 [Deltaproteobacteria bacterium]|nr:hypothetical protein [Deltaproteobacteria bacterium]MDL1960376.1 hypothetical protein [Deltaproteobacteria bacterium]